MAHVRTSHRATSTDARFAAAFKIASAAWAQRQFEEDADGRRIRVWGDPNVDWVTKDDVRQWLKGSRVVEDLRDGLEYVRDSYIKMMVKESYLRKDPRASYYWVTFKAACYFDLQPVMGCNFPR